MKKNEQYFWLDFVRGLAALAVFIGHLRIICFHDVPVNTLNIIGKLIFFVTGFGHIAVIIFFVLSGFLIIQSIHQSTLRNSWNVKAYAESRLSRLWVVLLPALVLGLIFDKLGLQYYGNTLFYSNKWVYFFNQDLAGKLSPAIFFGNLFFLQKILVPTLGSNGSLWSLSYEFWYYVIFPLFFLASINLYKPLTRVILALAGFAVLYFVGADIAMNFTIWLMGGLSYILLRVLADKHLQSKLLLFITTSAFLIAIVALRSKHFEQLLNFYTVGFIFCLSIPFLAKTSMRSVFMQRISSYLSNISYTLYLAHLPFVYLVTAMLNFQGKESTNTNYCIYIGIILLTLVYSSVLWYLFERNTKKIKKWVNDRTLKKA